MCYIQYYIEVMPPVVLISNQVGQFGLVDVTETARLKEHTPGLS